MRGVTSYVGAKQAIFNVGTAAHTSHYRPEIDGLRALAILPVVLFHYRLAPFRGGFVGVDVFFVISGYLITALIHGEMCKGRFSIARFYERRVRRIFPALFAMLAVVSIAAAFILFPFDFARYARSLLATAVFGSNFEFWNEAGYFDVASDQKPLLHLWSIAVEEQFYLLFPAILLLCGRGSRAWLLASVGAIFAASFALGVWGVVHAPAATFYLLPGRAWELMLGALIALGAVPPIPQRWLRESLAAGGIGLILFATLAFNSQMPFPGPAALVPCLGAALVIWATDAGATFTGNALSQRPIVFVGLISYSLYLWHWPLYVLAKYVLFRGLSPVETAAAIAASFALAALSWRFVERPFRRRSGIARAKLFFWAVGAMAATAASAAFVVAANGLPERLRPDVRSILAEEEDHEPRFDRCFGLNSRNVREGRLCRIGSGSQTPSFILWGDSHADAILPAVDDVASHEGRIGLFAGARSCAPLLGVTKPSAPDCRAFNDEVVKLAMSHEITEVILEARWAKNAEGTSYGVEPQGDTVLVDDKSQSGDAADNHAVFERGLVRTVQTLVDAGKKVIVVASVPEIGWPVPAVLARLKLANESRNMAPAVATYFERQRFVMDVLARLKAIHGVSVIYPHEVLCAGGSCEVARDGIPLYRDEHHLSVYGARLLDPLLASAL
jgi:peptidoglycan/LPS O-acetylase OafA/YrhL